MIIDFPNPSERDWHELEVFLREKYKALPDGPATLKECLPAILTHFQEIFFDVHLPVPPAFQIPGTVTEEQGAAIIAAIENGAQYIVKQLKSERHRHFGLLVDCEYQAAYFRRNGNKA
jgi:hypothetical protein